MEKANMFESMDSVKELELYVKASAANFPEYLGQIEKKVDQKFSQRDENAEPTPFYSSGSIFYANHEEAEQTLKEIKAEMPELVQFVETYHAPLTPPQEEQVQKALETAFQEIREGRSAPDFAAGIFRQKDIDMLKTYSQAKMMAYEYYPEVPADRKEKEIKEDIVTSFPEDVKNILANQGLAKNDIYFAVREHACAHLTISAIMQNKDALLANAEQERAEAAKANSSFIDKIKARIADACSAYKADLNKNYYSKG